ncbi:unnamed protein product [Allacma fusca]|uniref:Uncharacterized protein n=1 Tax=Allacma fusca TaxID=39272 RepID=A0A8J2JCT4_9HEXA|nr:unnamed protein product [Allacma fusca]
MRRYVMYSLIPNGLFTQMDEVHGNQMSQISETSWKSIDDPIMVLSTACSEQYLDKNYLLIWFTRTSDLDNI